jgi:hypothetical protein
MKSVVAGGKVERKMHNIEIACIKDVERDATAEPAVGRGGALAPYHRGSHGNPSKLPVEILRRRKEEEEEGGRRAHPLHPILDSPLARCNMHRG